MKEAVLGILATLAVPSRYSCEMETYYHGFHKRSRRVKASPIGAAIWFLVMVKMATMCSLSKVYKLCKNPRIEK